MKSNRSYCKRTVVPSRLQQKLLETLVAFSVAEGLSKMVDQELQQLKNMFNLMDENLKQIGKTHKKLVIL